MKNLSFLCKGSKDHQSYEVASLNFDSDSSRSKMVDFLDNVKAKKISNLKMYSEYSLEDSKPGRSKLMIVDHYINSLSIRDLLMDIKKFKFFEIIFDCNQFRLSLITCLWETLRDLRESGLKNMGI